MYNSENDIGSMCGYKMINNIKYVDRLYSQWKYNL